MSTNLNLFEQADLSIDFFSQHLDKLRRFNSRIIHASSLINGLNTNADLSDFETLNKLNSLSSLVTITQLDLIVSIKYLYTSKFDWERIFFIKNIYLTVYESIVTYNKYSPFLNSLIKIKSPDMKNEFFIVSKEIRSFKKKYKYENHISKVRNSISGHISEDFELFYDTVTQFNGDETGKMSIDFFNLLTRLQRFLTMIVNSEKMDEHQLVNDFKTFIDKYASLFLKIS